MYGTTSLKKKERDLRSYGMLRNVDR